MTQKLSRHCAILAAALSLGGTFASSLSAEAVTTRPVGAMTYTLPDATAAAQVTHLSVPLVSAPTFVGPVASLTASTLTFSGTPFTAGALAVSGSPYFLRIASGLQVGRTILVTANTANSVTLDTTDNSTQTTALDSAGFAVVVGDKVELIQGDTIASLFGDGSVANPLVLHDGTNVVNADTVAVFNKVTNKNDTFYFNSTSKIWRTSAVAASRNNQVLYPENGVIIGRPQALDRLALGFTVLGEVPAISPRVKVTGPGTTIHTGTSYPVDVTLGQLALTGWLKGTNVVNSDTIAIFNSSTGKFDSYWQRSTDNFWIKQGSGTSDRSGFTIKAGTAFRISRSSSALAVANATSFVSMPLPYSL